MLLEVIDGDLSLCKVRDYSQVDFDAPFCFTGKTDGERSLVCLTRDVPGNTAARDDGWRAFRVAGTLDFSLVGILARISAIIAEQGVGIFAISTYDTDYVLVKAGDFAKALDALKGAGYEIR